MSEIGVVFSYQVPVGLLVIRTLPPWPTAIYSGTPLSPTAHLLNKTSYNVVVIPDVCAVQVAPSADVWIIPPEPTAINLSLSQITCSYVSVWLATRVIAASVELSTYSSWFLIACIVRSLACENVYVLSFNDPTKWSNTPPV